MPRRVELSAHLNQPLVDQVIDRVSRISPAYLVYIRPRHRLMVRYDRERLERAARQVSPALYTENRADAVDVLLFRAELTGVVEDQQLYAARLVLESSPQLLRDCPRVVKRQSERLAELFEPDRIPGGE